MSVRLFSPVYMYFYVKLYLHLFTYVIHVVYTYNLIRYDKRDLNDNKKQQHYVVIVAALGIMSHCQLYIDNWTLNRYSIDCFFVIHFDFYSIDLSLVSSVCLFVFYEIFSLIFFSDFCFEATRSAPPGSIPFACSSISRFFHLPLIFL